jgi:8-oxo-dGTP diphosphatase
MRYTHATVRLHCWRVHAWNGDMRGMEGQLFQWQSIDALTVSPTLPGCVPIFKALRLPRVYAITNAAVKGVAQYHEDLRRALQSDVRLIQVREKSMAPDALQAFARNVVMEAHAYGAKVLINGDAALALDVGADGVHLTAAKLGACSVRPDFPLVAASTHRRSEIEHAGELGLDFVVLGAVKKTLTHPEQVPIGWSRFGEIAYATPIPVFAIGGLALPDMKDAIEYGAHGIAAQRAFS